MEILYYKRSFGAQDRASVVSGRFQYNRSIVYCDVWFYFKCSQIYCRLYACVKGTDFHLMK